MRTQNISTRLFRLLAVMIVFVMAFSQVAGVAQAQGTPPPGKERVQIAPVGLDEVQNYYGAWEISKAPWAVNAHKYK